MPFYCIKLIATINVIQHQDIEYKTWDLVSKDFGSIDVEAMDIDVVDWSLVKKKKILNN